MRAQNEIEKHSHPQTMSATAFIVSGMCHDAEQKRHMNIIIADYTAHMHKDAHVHRSSNVAASGTSNDVTSAFSPIAIPAKTPATSST